MTIRWPVNVLAPTTVNFDIAPRTLAGPSAVSGFTQVSSSSAGIWRFTLANIPVYTKAHALTWRAIDAILEGRLGTILVPLCRGYQPTPAGADYAPVPFSDDATFGDGSEFQGSAINVQLTTAIIVGAVSASVSISYADTLQPGQHFSLGERLYRLKSVIYTSNTTADIKFTPPAREAASAGDRLEFDDPVCRMRLASDMEMALPLEMRRLANPTVNFLEDV